MTNTAQYLSIREAAKKLGVSIDTLRRWEKQNVIKSERTLGGHRRYSIEQLLWAKNNLKKYTPRNISIPESSPVQIITETTTEIGFKVEDMPAIYSTLHIDQKKILSTTMVVFSLVFFLFLGSKVLASDQIKSQMIAGASMIPFVGEHIESIASKLNIGNQKGSIALGVSGRVLQAATGTPSFTVNIDANFAENVSVAKDLTVGGNLILTNALVVPSLEATTTISAGTDITAGGDLNVNGGAITTTATTFELLTDATTLSIGGTSGTTTINNNLAVTGTGTVTGKLTASGDFAVSGSSTLGSVTAGATTVSSLTDSGTLTVSGLTTLNDLTLADTKVLNIGGSGSTVAYNLIGNTTSGADATMDADNDLYVQGDFQVGGTITGTVTGNFDPGFTLGSVYFQGASGGEEDNTNFFWDDSNNRLGIGTNSPSRTLSVTGSTLITNNTTTNTTIDLTSTGDFTVADGGTAFITFNSNGNVVLADNRLLDLSAVVHDDSSPQGLKLPQATSFTAIADGEGYLAWNTNTNTLATFDGSSWTNLTGSTNYFTDDGTITYLTSATDDFALGGSTAESPFFVDVSQSAIHLNPFGASAGNTGAIRFEELEANGDHYTGFKSPDSLVASVVYTLPTADATANNQVLASNTAGELAWIDVSSGSGSHWTSTGSIVHLTNNTDDFALGGSTADAALFFDVSQSGLHLNPFGAGAGNTSELRFEELEANGDSYTGFKSPDSLAGSVVYTLPDQDATTANQILASNGTGGLSWIDITGGSNSPFSKSSTNVYLTTTTDELILGGSSPLSSAKFSIDGDTDQIQLIVQGNGTQTSNLATFEQSDGTDVFTINNAGNLTAAGNLDINGSGTHDLAGTLNLSGNALTSSGDLTVTPAGGDVDFVSNITTTGDVAVNGGDLTTAATTFNLLNATATTINFGGGATTALNIGNGNTAYTAINLGSGTGGNTINIAGTGATGADTINIGTGGTAADTINLGSSAGATAISLTTGTGSQTFTSSVATGTLTSGAFVFRDTAITSGDMVYATASAITSGSIVKIGQGGDTTFSGNALAFDIAGSAFSGNFISASYLGSTRFTVGATGTVSAGGVYTGTSGTNTRLQATGTSQGSTGNSSIYFLDNSGTTRGRFDTVIDNNSVDTNFGTGADGALVVNSGNTYTFNSTATGQRTVADSVAYRVTPPASGNSMTRYDSSISLNNGIKRGDEVLVMNMQGTTGDLADVGKYEFKRVSEVTTSTISFTSDLTNSYDGTSAAAQKVIVQRVPNYTDVTIGGTITASAWASLNKPNTPNSSYLTGVVAFRATGNTIVNSGGSITASGKGYLGGSGGITNTGGNGGESYDGFVGAGGGNEATGNSGGGSGGNSSTTSPNNGATRSGGGGGGGANGGPQQTGGSGGGGGGHAGGGGGGGAGGDRGTGASHVGQGGTGSTAGTAAGGGGGGTSGGGGNAGNGGNAGSNGAASPTGGAGGNVGSGAVQGSGGGASTGSNESTGGGGGGGGIVGNSALATLFLGGGGGGGGGSSTNNSVTGTNGSQGGGIIFIVSGNVTINSGATIQSAGNSAVPSSDQGGGGGAGAGGTIGIIGGAVTLGTNLVTAAGGNAGNGGNAGQFTPPQGGGGGGGGEGRIRVEYTGSISGTTTPTVSSQASINSDKQAPAALSTLYGTLYAGSVNTGSADLAENYVAGDESITAGDVVSIVPMNVVDENGNIIETKGVLGKSSGAYDSQVVGIVSTEPGLLLGSDDTVKKEKVAPLALSGRVPVKIDPGSEEINIGDYLTSSDTSGTAMKATKAGYTIAKALEPWKPGQSGTITAFVNLGYYMGSLTADGSFDTGNSFIANDVSVKTDKSLIDRILGNNQNEEATGSSEVNSASESGTLNIAEALSKFIDRLEGVESDITLLKAASLNDTNDSGSVLGNSTGLVTIDDLVVTNGINIGTLGLTDGSIDSIGTLKIQSSGLGNIELQGNNIEIDTKGNLNIKTGKIIGNDSIRGSETISTGQTNIQVNKAWDSAPKSVTITPSYNTNVWVTGKTKDGFIINVSSAPSTNAQVDWFAIW